VFATIFVTISRGVEKYCKPRVRAIFVSARRLIATATTAAKVERGEKKMTNFKNDKKNNCDDTCRGRAIATYLRRVAKVTHGKENIKSKTLQKIHTHNVLATLWRLATATAVANVDGE